MANIRHLFRLLLALSLAVLINAGPLAASMAAPEAAKMRLGQSPLLT